MHYFEKYNYLTNLYHQKEGTYNLTDFNVQISNYNFKSSDADVLSGGTKYICKRHDMEFDGLEKESLSDLENETLFPPDIKNSFNSDFIYSVVKPQGYKKSDKAILLFHGFNEKKWDKYLPWAVDIAEKMNRPVILFPIAFHMNRADERWSDREFMYSIAKKRMQSNPSNSQTSYVNAAISLRLEAEPQRFFWGGLQTFYDTINLCNSIKSGKHQDFSENTDIDILSYSIGSFLSLILLMADSENLFSDSRLFCFCGGATFDRMYAASKYIMDNQSTVKMQSFYSTQLNCNFIAEKRLSHYLSDEHPEGFCFKKVLNYHHYLPEREARIKEISSRISALALEKDDVIPPDEVLNTLRGKYRSIPTEVSISDYPFPYSHITMFNLMPRYANEVDLAYNDFINRVISFLG